MKVKVIIRSRVLPEFEGFARTAEVEEGPVLDDLLRGEHVVVYDGAPPKLKKWADNTKDAKSDEAAYNKAMGIEVPEAPKEPAAKKTAKKKSKK